MCLTWCGSHVEWVYPQLRYYPQITTTTRIFNSNSFYNESSGSSMVRTHPCAHPQHLDLEVVRNLIFLCVWHWCGSHIEWIYNLKYGTTMLWFVPAREKKTEFEETSKSLPNKSGGRGTSRMVRTHPHAHHPQHWEVVNHNLCDWHWHWCESHLELVYTQLWHNDVVCSSGDNQNP